MIAYLKGTHLSLDLIEDIDVPKDMAPVPRLLSDLKALKLLLEGPEPRRIQVSV